MSTAPIPIGHPMLFNALNGNEVKEIILRKVRDSFDADERFRHHATYPELKYKFSLSMTYAPGMAEALNVSGAIDVRAKATAQGMVIEALQKQLADKEEKFRAIEAEAGLMISDLEKKTRDLADANEFIRKLHAEKLELERTVAAGVAVRQQDEFDPFPKPNPVYDLDALASGGEILVTHESEVIDEPDKLRESGETLNPETIEIEVGGEGEAQGEAIPQMNVVGRQPNEVRNLDHSLKLPTEGTGATVSAGRPPSGVKGRPRG